MVESPSGRRKRLRRAAEVLAGDQDGIASRRQLRGLGVDRVDVRTQLCAQRWQKPSAHTVAVFTGELTQRQSWWMALLETGCADVALDGVTALQAAGLDGLWGPTTLSCPHGAKPRRIQGVQIHVTRWRRPDDHISAGIPRVRPHAAAVRGALWAGSNRQAALILVMTVQQRLTTPRHLALELAQIGQHPKRLLLTQVLGDITDGAHALGEIDFAVLCRRHRLPTPSRQVLRQGHRGRCYLDVYFDGYGLAVEIDGIQHSFAANQIEDALRQNEISLASDVVLRIPLVGLRTEAAEFMAQIARALCQRGWQAV